MTSDQKEGGGVKNCSKFVYKQFRFCEQRGGGGQKIPKFCGCHIPYLVVQRDPVLEPGDLGRRPAPGRALQHELAAAPRLQQLGRGRSDLHERLRL